MARILWEDLPPELLEIVLACLPAHVLCRFRLVCKRWNHLITQPGFASLHAQAPRQASYVLISPKLLDCHPGLAKNWEILDMAEKRFYTLSDSFITDNLLCSLTTKAFLKYRGWTKYALAANGGFIYAIYISSWTGDSRHIVCNPMSKDFHQLMKPKRNFSYGHDIVVMSVDNATKTYRIVITESFDSAARERELVHLYDSTTTQWRKLCEVPHKYRAYSSIFHKGIFYTLFVDTSVIPWCPKVYSCNLETGEWNYIHVIELPCPSCPQDKSQLVVSLGRLFFVDYTRIPTEILSSSIIAWETRPLVSNPVRKKQLIKVSIWEILLDKKEVVMVAEMPANQYPQALMGEAVVAVGCDDSIVISSLVGGCVGFDLLKHCWHELPAKISEHMYDTNCGGDSYHRGIYAGLVHLDLRDMTPSRIDERLTM